MIKVILLFHYILFKYNAEYLDFYTSEKFTDDEERYINKNSYNNSIIIPNYYEPFIQSNVKVRYGIFANKKKNNFLFFKGEGDGERPNLI